MNKTSNQGTEQRTFLSDAMDIISMGVHSIENDSFSECFKSFPRFKMYNSGILYIFSFIFRYFILFPFRLIILLVGIGLVGGVFGYGIFFKNENAIYYSFWLFFRLFVLVFNCRLRHHGNKKKIDLPHIYVANHTTIIDYLLLSSHKFHHACISERHGGFFGYIFNSFIAMNGSISFRRSNEQDRKMVLESLKKHIATKKAPMLVFPEGTCVNNECVLLFQKGVFELDALICPVAIRYDKRLFDPYWNRRKNGFLGHLFYLITRWKIEADIHWLDPLRRNNNETAVDFGHRIKQIIADKINIKNLLWDGTFKSSPKLRNREVLRTAYKNVYLKVKNLKLESDNKSFYFFNENISSNLNRNPFLFNKIYYSDFVKELCKEYLRLKTEKQPESQFKILKRL